MSYSIETKGLDAFDALVERLGDAVLPSAAKALNDTAPYARTQGDRRIRQRFNFKASYLAARLVVSKQARADNLEAVVTGRDRPTSLARFATGAPRFGKQSAPPSVRVKTVGGARPIRNGFFMRLRKGSSIVSAENANIGLAVRLKEGERVRNKNNMVPIGGDLYLLYGPSVGQIYRTESEKTVDVVSAHLAERFAHHVQRAL